MHPHAYLLAFEPSHIDAHWVLQVPWRSGWKIIDLAYVCSR